MVSQAHDAPALEPAAGATRGGLRAQPHSKAPAPPQPVREAQDPARRRAGAADQHGCAGRPNAPAKPWRQPAGGGHRDGGIAFLWALGIILPYLAFSAWSVGSAEGARRAEKRAAAEQAQAWERLVAAPAQPVLPVDLAAHGRDVFAAACVACHGTTGTGGIGKNLAESDFVASRSDDEMLGFIVEGRPRALPYPMPPRGGRDDLSDADVAAVVVFLRGLQDARRMPPLPEPVHIAAAGEMETMEQALAAAGGDEELAEYILSGSRLYATTCIACHGPAGAGMPGNGKPLAGSAFVAGLDDDGLLVFVQRGRDPGDPKNTTGVGMPAKGGNPALLDDDLLDIISYLRTLGPGGGAAVGQGL
jgi:mono/diheme cytochrome c family protein